MEKITRFIIKTVQEESILSGFQYTVDFSLVKNTFDIELTEKDKVKIQNALSICEEVAEVDILEDAFDVTLYTKFAPNYIEDEEDEELY